MKNMSFAMTTEQVANQTKTVTRRFGWDKLKCGQLIQPVEKVMGFKKGDKIVKIGGPIQIVNIRKEQLWEITRDDVILEGFPDMMPEQFVQMMIDKFRCKPRDIVNRIEFKYLYGTVIDNDISECCKCRWTGIDDEKERVLSREPEDSGLMLFTLSCPMCGNDEFYLHINKQAGQ